MSTHNICFHEEVRKYFLAENSALSRAMILALPYINMLLAGQDIH